jgi:hypothetical protein
MPVTKAGKGEGKWEGALASFSHAAGIDHFRARCPTFWAHLFASPFLALPLARHSYYLRSLSLAVGPVACSFARSRLIVFVPPSILYIHICLPNQETAIHGTARSMGIIMISCRVDGRSASADLVHSRFSASENVVASKQDDPVRCSAVQSKIIVFRCPSVYLAGLCSDSSHTRHLSTHPRCHALRLSSSSHIHTPSHQALVIFSSFSFTSTSLIRPCRDPPSSRYFTSLLSTPAHTTIFRPPQITVPRINAWCGVCGCAIHSKVINTLLFGLHVAGTHSERSFPFFHAARNYFLAASLFAATYILNSPSTRGLKIPGVTISDLSLINAAS